jgi:hypothetical protein
MRPATQCIIHVSEPETMGMTRWENEFRKMRESIEIEKLDTIIDQDGKLLDSTWRALFNVQN